MRSEYFHTTFSSSPLRQNASHRVLFNRVLVHLAFFKYMFHLCVCAAPSCCCACCRASVPITTITTTIKLHHDVVTLVTFHARTDLDVDDRSSAEQRGTHHRRRSRTRSQSVELMAPLALPMPGWEAAVTDVMLTILGGHTGIGQRTLQPRRLVVAVQANHGQYDEHLNVRQSSSRRRVVACSAALRTIVAARKIAWIASRS